MNQSVTIKIYEILDDKILNDVFSLEQVCFETPYSKEKLQRETSFKHNLRILIAYKNNQPVGYKAGYELSSRVFYSWIGGVHPDFRGQGIAKKLMQKQHALIADLGHTSVRTKTQNKYKDMLILNLNFGFDIIGVYKSDQEEKQIIMLEKII